MAFESLFHFMRDIKGKINGSVMNTTSSQNASHIAYIRSLQKDMKQGKDLYLPLDKLTVVIIDMETTGFFPEQGGEMISIGAIKMCGKEIVEEESFYSLIRYEKELSPEIIELTGIRPADLFEAPLLEEVLVQFFQFVGHSTLVAHHANHEKSFLQNVSWKLFRAPFKHRIVDTSFLYRIADPECKLVRLEDFCEYNGIPVVDRHHALGDAKLTAKIWSIYMDKVQQRGCRTLHDVYERLAKLL